METNDPFSELPDCPDERPYVEHYPKYDEKPEPARADTSELLVQCCAWAMGVIIAGLVVGSIYEMFQF